MYRALRHTCAILGLLACVAGCADDEPLEDTGQDPEDSGTGIDTAEPDPEPEPPHPAMLMADLRFGWDASSHEVVSVDFMGWPFPPTVTMILLSQYAEWPDVSDGQQCTLMFRVDVAVSSLDDVPAGTRLILEVTDSSEPTRHDCEGWDLTWLGAEPSAIGWKFEVREQLEMDFPIPVPYLGASVESPMFEGTHRGYTNGSAVDEDHTVLLQDAYTPVPLERDQMLQAPTLTDGWYSVVMSEMAQPEL